MTYDQTAVATAHSCGSPETFVLNGIHLKRSRGCSCIPADMSMARGGLALCPNCEKYILVGQAVLHSSVRLVPSGGKHDNTPPVNLLIEAKYSISSAQQNQGQRFYSFLFFRNKTTKDIDGFSCIASILLTFTSNVSLLKRIKSSNLFLFIYQLNLCDPGEKLFLLLWFCCHVSSGVG